MHRAIGAVLAAATIGLAACGGSSNDHTTAAQAASNTTAAASSAASTTSVTAGDTSSGATPSTTDRPTPGAGATSTTGATSRGAGATTTTSATSRPGGTTQHKAPATVPPAGKPAATSAASKAPASSKAPTSTTDPKKAPGSKKAPAGNTAPTAKPPVAKHADPQAAAKAKVVAGFDAGFKAYEHCIVAPESCDYATASADGSPLRVWLVENVVEKIEYHLRARAGSGPMTYKVEGVRLAPGGTSAAVTTCIVDGMVVYDIADPVNPFDDIVFNDRLVATRTSWTMSLTRVGWRRSAAHVVKEWIGKDRCS